MYNSEAELLLKSAQGTPGAIIGQLFSAVSGSASCKGQLMRLANCKENSKTVLECWELAGQSYNGAQWPLQQIRARQQ